MLAVDRTLNRYAYANSNVTALAQGNALGEDCYRIFRQDVTISFKAVKLN